MKNDAPFLDPGELRDGDFRLVLVEKRPADPVNRHVPVYNWDIRRVPDDVKMGEFGLKIGELPPHIGHNRYRVFPEFRGKHIAARACRLIIPLARRHAIDPIRISCRENNIASRRTAELAGAKLDRIVETPDDYTDWMGPVSTECDYHLATQREHGQQSAVLNEPPSGARE
jgi:tagatose 1,6-diphosphate aldolase